MHVTIAANMQACCYGHRLYIFYAWVLRLIPVCGWYIVACMHSCSYSLHVCRRCMPVRISYTRLVKFYKNEGTGVHVYGKSKAISCIL